MHATINTFSSSDAGLRQQIPTIVVLKGRRIFRSGPLSKQQQSRRNLQGPLLLIVT